MRRARVLMGLRVGIRRRIVGSGFLFGWKERRSDLRGKNTLLLQGTIVRVDLL
jgi:hypothetical protein